MVTDILSSADSANARAFIEAQGLSFDPSFDDLVGVFDRGAPSRSARASARS